MVFDNATKVHWDERGEFVFDWARADGELPVRVQAHRMYVVDNWGLDWNNQVAILARFDREKHKHIPSLHRAAGGSMPSFRVYVIG